MNNKTEHKLTAKLILLGLFSVLFIFSCSCDETSFRQISIKLFTEKNHRLHPPVFETVTEQVLIREGHNEGASFETVFEQVLLIESHTHLKIMDYSEVSMVVNEATLKTDSIPCIDFYNPSEFQETEIPSIYETRFYQKVDQDGTGPLQDPVYGTIQYEKLVFDAVIQEIANHERSFQIFEFYIPEDIDIMEYLSEQLVSINMDHCLQPGDYEILE